MWVCVLDIIFNEKCLLCRDYCPFQLPIRRMCILRFIYVYLYSEVRFIWTPLYCTHTLYTFAVDFFFCSGPRKYFYSYFWSPVLSHCFAHVSLSKILLSIFSFSLTWWDRERTRESEWNVAIIFINILISTDVFWLFWTKMYCNNFYRPSQHC